MSFEALNLASPILRALATCGYSAPTPIQAQAIPVALEGRDLIGSAQTGTGKTAAFVLPALQRLMVPSQARGKGPRILVLTPTRELATQVIDAARSYGKFMRLRCGAILGGMPYREQHALLSQPVDLIVATPGRLIDHLERGRLNLNRLELLILDEADRMLDMGFSEDIDKIAAAAPVERQTLLFTATMDDPMAKIARRLLKDPERIDIPGEEVSQVQIEQRLHVADDLRHKARLLQHLISDASVTKAIIFSATKKDADALALDLYSQGHAAAALHGDMSQGARNRTITMMRRGKVRLLVATDVAARGLDVTGVSHVINFDLPKFAEDYVHRIGRTGRAGASGVAISFCSMNEVAYLDRIERYTGHQLPVHVIPGLEPSRPLRRANAGGPRKGFGKKPFAQGKKPFAAGNKPSGQGKGRPGPASRPGRDQQVVVEYRRGNRG
ncbi:DEAD/DEAH box helicase [Geomesophilobacter sediminis]|uniref:DEAD/DEAH box helicase n=1 Tax=Geomesophilobacter sediminis TaxID=2798584 RepID=A0A8J7JG90_9BACT|nr:DEAD/DEAH box helicase [Geomesophilobacter sediminis]MBJ6725634.1 DEAD/DEAH box helicase [Geomesophilobacter sediminis]